MSNAPLPYHANCIGWPPEDVDAPGGLRDMISDRLEISRRTFLKHVDRPQLRALEEDLGYMPHPRQGKTMAADGEVTYYKSRLHGVTCYYVAQSAVEHVFAACQP